MIHKQLGGEQACVEVIIHKLLPYFRIPFISSQVSDFDTVISVLEIILVF